MDATLTVSSPTRARGAATLGWVLTGLISAFLGFDAVIHLLNIGPVQAGTARLGFVDGSAVVMGSVEAVALVLYLVRRTSVFGALLLTAYLGGAFTAQLRIDAPLFTTLLFPVYTALFVWGGLWLRDAGVRALLPIRAR